MTKTFGLIGYPLKNSFSKDFFTKKFLGLNLPYTYQNFEIDNLKNLPTILKNNPTLGGFNITIPHKQNIIPYLTSIDESAKAIGAVNCVKILGNQLIGYNTDVYGFMQSFLPFVEPIINQKPKALILGNGGAAKAVKYVLNQLQIEFLVVSRTGNLTYKNLTSENLAKLKIIINCTPLGMFPKLEEAPEIDYTALGSNHYCYDLIYLPKETMFLKQAKKQGAQTKNGLEMLHLQAEKNWKIWSE